MLWTKNSYQNILTFFTPYSRHFKDITNTIRKYLPILHQYPDLEQILRNTEIRFVSRKNRTLGSILSPTVLPSSSSETCLDCKGCYRCGKTCCGTCKHVEHKKEFISVQTQQFFSIQTFINCSTAHLVYLITCKDCMLQYVGSTIRTLCTRIEEHLNDIKQINNFDRSMSNASKHFRNIHQGDVSSFLVQAIENVKKPPQVC